MTAASRYQDIIFDEVDDGIGRITLNRPDKLNAYTPRMCAELRDAFAAYAANDGQRVLILTGSGRGFCSGGDLPGEEYYGMAAERQFGHASVMRESIHPAFLALYGLAKPTIAMINGAAVAGGLAFALLCDIRIASDRARLGDTSGLVGLLPDEGGAWLFPRAMGLERALRMSLLNEVYDASQAERLGLVSEVVPHDELNERTSSVARHLATRAPIAVRMVKRMMLRGIDTSYEHALQEAELAVVVANDTEDVQEGIEAFFEKRNPVFKGR